jgi:hypothetical protein
MGMKAETQTAWRLQPLRDNLLFAQISFLSPCRRRESATKVFTKKKRAIKAPQKSGKKYVKWRLICNQHLRLKLAACVCYEKYFRGFFSFSFFTY